MNASPDTPSTVLILRTCDANVRAAYNGFQWPTSGPVEAPDWSPEKICGFGLHGLLWGEGDGSLLDWSETAKWLVVEVAAVDVVELNGKVKFPRGNVVYCGDRLGATSYIAAVRPGAIVGATVTAGHRGTATAGDWGTATAGYSGTATAGDWGTATAGDWGTATAGHWGTATAGHRGTATAGHRGTATAGYSGTATAGYSGTATAGDWGTATAGDCGTATAGYSGTATAGDWGTATAGNYGTATAGDGGTIQLKYYDYSAERHRTVTGYVGEDGIEANVKYRLEAGKFVKA